MHEITSVSREKVTKAREVEYALSLSTELSIRNVWAH